MAFRKLVAILRFTVPYTGIIISTRETPDMRRTLLALGLSRISAGSRTHAGGYKEDEQFDASPFLPDDRRTLDVCAGGCGVYV